MDVSGGALPPEVEVVVEVVPVPRPRRTRYVVAGALCLGAIGFLLFGGLKDNIVYFRTVSEAVAERADEGDGRLRMAGTVVAGSVTRAAGGVSFTVTEGGESVEVFHRGDPPELFAPDVPVVCEGRWDGTRFASDRIMIKHGSTYKPPSDSASDPADPADSFRPESDS